jgi:hypothetical protein
MNKIGEKEMAKSKKDLGYEIKKAAEYIGHEIKENTEQPNTIQAYRT